MFDLPLHPAVVHLPLGLGVVVPLIGIVALVRLWRAPSFRSTVWALVLLTQTLTAAFALVAEKTGEQDEEIVERVVPRSEIHVHEEHAELLVGISIFAFVLSAAAFVGPGKFGRVLAAASVLASTAAAAQTLRVGHSGGALVYQHQAASAHTTGAATPKALPND